MRLAPWIASGAHIAALGADKGGDQELDPRILQALGYLYFEGEPGRRSAANLLTKDEA